MNFEEKFTKETYDRMRKLMDSKVFSVFPVNIPDAGKKHWYLLMVHRPDFTSTSSTSLYLLDPLNQKNLSSDHYETKLQPFLEEVLKTSHTKFNINFVQVPAQVNAFDCGIHLMLFVSIIWFKVNGNYDNVQPRHSLLKKLENYAAKFSCIKNVNTLRQNLHAVTERLLPKDIVIKYSGIQNEGSTCFINVVLQIIFCWSDILVEMYEDIFIKQINKFEKPLFRETWMIILDLFSHSLLLDGRLSSTFIGKQHIRKFRDHLKLYAVNLDISENHDSDPHELLIHLIDIGGPYCHSLRFNLKSTKICIACKSSNPRVLHHDNSSFDIPLNKIGNHRNITSIVDNFYNGDDINCYCEICKCDCSHNVVDVYMDEHPKILLFQIGRYSGKSNNEVVDIFGNDFEGVFFGKTYRLKGVVYHTGESTDKGHYFVECMRPTKCSSKIQNQDWRWHKFDDSKVTVFSEKHQGFKGEKDKLSKMTNCYLLMYVRMNPEEKHDEEEEKK